MNKVKEKVFIIVVALVTLILVILWGNTALKMNKYTVKSSRLPESFEFFCIAQVSDLHNTKMGKDNEKLLQMLQKAEPDMIVITGDMVDSIRTDIEVALQFARQAVKIAPCFYVTGNHEARIPDHEYAELEKGLVEAGVHVLRNKEVKIEKDGEWIVLAGIDDPDFATAQISMESLTDVTPKSDIESLNNNNVDKISELFTEDEFKVLISHRPELFQDYVKADVDLVLAGHAHGGQFRLPFVGGLIAPNQGFFPEYDAGLFIEDNTNMIVSRGIGNSIIPIRINNRPEVVVVELRKTDQETSQVDKVKSKSTLNLDANVQDVKMPEFTMEDLIALCDSGDEILKDALTNFSENGELPYSNLERDEMEGSLTWSYFCMLPYGEREYRLQASYWKPENAKEYGYMPNELSHVTLYYPKVEDRQLLYDTDKRYTPDLDIRSFLECEYDIHQFLELELPEGLEMGDYQAGMVIGDEGCLFTGDYEVLPHDGEFTPEEWYAPGGVEFIEKEYFPGEIIFEDGRLKEVMVPMNHSGVDSEFEFLDGCDMQAVLCEYFFELFTAPAADEYKQEHGLSAEDFQFASRYWYVFFAEEDSQYVYMLFLNQEYFDKGDIVKVARSVKFKVK